MLVIGRNRGERIVIGDGLVELQVMEIRGTQVRLGFTADKDVPIHRKEVQQKIERENILPRLDLASLIAWIRKGRSIVREPAAAADSKPTTSPSGDEDLPTSLAS